MAELQRESLPAWTCHSPACSVALSNASLMAKRGKAKAKVLRRSMLARSIQVASSPQPLGGVAGVF